MKIECNKCDGSGIIRAYMHIDNGRCFSCKGKGHFVTTKAKEDRKASKRAAKKVESDKAAVSYKAKSDALVAKYANDSRIGPDRKATCQKHDCVARETAEILAEWDNTPGWADKFPWIARNLAR